MKIGIIGLPQTGKKTLFHLLTGTDVAGRDGMIPQLGIVTIRDPRFDKLVTMYSPKKESPASIEITLAPRIDKESIRNGALLKHIEDVEAVCHVVRAFDSEQVYHVDGSVDPRRDIDMINSELVLSDLLLLEKRLERIGKALKGKTAAEQGKEKVLLLKLKAHLEDEKPLRLLKLDADENKLLSAYRFLTVKPMVIVLNVSEGGIKGSAALDEMRSLSEAQGITVVKVSVRIEQELAALDSDEEKKAFLDDLGIDEPAVDKLTRALHGALGLIFFFTVGEKEVHAWTVRKGAAAPEAAGKIHSDLERGFVRAEVMRYEELLSLGSESKVKEAGKFMVKGKDYIVEDGDVLGIRFSV